MAPPEGLEGCHNLGYGRAFVTTHAAISVVPANEASWEDLQAVLSARRGQHALARAAVDFARERGARAIEGYPMITQPGQEITWGELHVGGRSIFAAAGFVEVSETSKPRSPDDSRGRGIRPSSQGSNAVRRWSAVYAR